MGFRSKGLVLAVAFVTLLTGCVKNAQVKKATIPINRVALVSLSVTNWGGTATGTSGSQQKAKQLIESRLSGMLVSSERELSRFVHVTHASTFVRSSSYRGLASHAELGAMVPRVGGKPMAVFAKDNNQLIGAALSPATAKQLCANLKVDAVVAVYSEWSYSQGRFVPTKRALAKNVVSVWDRTGSQIFHKRVDQDGTGVLGGPFAPIVVNDGTIKQWSGAYKEGFRQIAKEMKTTLKH